MFPEDGQNQVTLAMFPEGGQTMKHCFLAMFPEDGQTRKHWPCFLKVGKPGNIVSYSHVS
jgi:hypothetical protein